MYCDIENCGGQLTIKIDYPGVVVLGIPHYHADGSARIWLKIHGVIHLECQVGKRKCCEYFMEMIFSLNYNE